MEEKNKYEEIVEEAPLLGNTVIQIDEKIKNSFFNLSNVYENSFLTVVFLCNFAQGFKRLLDLGLYFVYKEKLGLQPSEIEILLGVINFPWVVKMLFGLISDNYTFFGSRRKSYLLTMVGVNLLSLCMLMIFAVKYGKYFITFCIFLTQLAMTYCDAMSDALIV